MTQPYSDAPAPGPEPTPTSHGSRPAMPDMRSLSRNDQVFLVATFVAFIGTFLPFARFKIAGIGSDDISAWHGVGALAALLLLLAVVAAALGAFASTSLPDLPVSPRLIAVALAGLAFLFLLLRWVTLPSSDVLGHHFGYSLFWGGYFTLIVTLVAVVFGVLGVRDSGEAMPWAHGASAGQPPAPPAA
jgi:hypothetical protein